MQSKVTQSMQRMQKKRMEGNTKNSKLRANFSRTLGVYTFLTNATAVEMEAARNRSVCSADPPPPGYQRNLSHPTHPIILVQKHRRWLMAGWLISDTVFF